MSSCVHLTCPVPALCPLLSPRAMALVPDMSQCSTFSLIFGYGTWDLGTLLSKIESERSDGSSSITTMLLYKYFVIAAVLTYQALWEVPLASKSKRNKLLFCQMEKMTVILLLLIFLMDHYIHQLLPQDPMFLQRHPGVWNSKLQLVRSRPRKTCGDVLLHWLPLQSLVHCLWQLATRVVLTFGGLPCCLLLTTLVQAGCHSYGLWWSLHMCF